MTKYVSLEHAIRNAVRDQNYKKVNEDFEFEMARNELRTAIDAAKRLMAQLDGEGDLEAWVQSKITKGADYLDTVADYMDSRDTKKLKEHTKEISESMTIIGNNAKFQGNEYTTPVHIAPGVTQAAVKSAGHRRVNKQQNSATLQGKVNEAGPAVAALPIAGAAIAAGGAAMATHLYNKKGLVKSIQKGYEVGKDNFIGNVENLKKSYSDAAAGAEAERAGEAEVGADYDKKKAEIAQSSAAMKRQAIDDADARDAAASKSMPKEIETPAPAATVATERKPNPFSTVAKASKSEFEATPPAPAPVAANTNKSIQIGADSIDGSKAPPIAPPAAGVSPAPGAVAIPGTNAPTAVPAIAAPILAGAAANAAAGARTQSKAQAQTQARAETKVETQKPSNGKGGRIPKLPFIPLPSLGGEYKAPSPNSEYHDVPVKTSVSQARAHRKFGSNSVSRFKQFREETGPDNTRRKDSSKELVGRPDSAGVKDPKSVLARNGSIKIKIIDEEKKLAGVVKSVIKKKKEEKESGPNPLVDFEPKLNHKYDNET